jgi:hypothetical protein
LGQLAGAEQISNHHSTTTMCDAQAHWLTFTLIGEIIAEWSSAIAKGGGISEPLRYGRQP